ncbi:hypothetical protein K353_04692 [Kitasatospora sp. SolWspMP-SS2h]|nr:hypothetical protein K353_04692 [Kitasatospora sp. SolWspMP-SS2h]
MRGGWDINRPFDQPVPGLDLSAVRWLDERGASVYVGDISDARPARPPMPVHQVALARLGLPLVDVADLEPLARHCEASNRWSFMLVLAPPRITGTTGLAVNPISIFRPGGRRARSVRRRSHARPPARGADRSRSGRETSRRRPLRPAPPLLVVDRFGSAQDADGRKGTTALPSPDGERTGEPGPIRSSVPLVLRRGDDQGSGGVLRGDAGRRGAVGDVEVTVQADDGLARGAQVESGQQAVRCAGARHSAPAEKRARNDRSARVW